MRKAPEIGVRQFRVDFALIYNVSIHQSDMDLGQREERDDHVEEAPNDGGRACAVHHGGGGAGGRSAALVDLGR
jgi:hypothetical protein